MADSAVVQRSVHDRNAYRRATERWENEGGATLAGLASLIRETLIDCGVRVAITEPAALPQVNYGQTPAAPAVARFTTETVFALRYWTPNLLSFRTSRAPDFRFTPGITRDSVSTLGTMAWFGDRSRWCPPRTIHISNSSPYSFRMVTFPTLCRASARATQFVWTKPVMAS